VGRVLNVAFGVLTVWITYLIVRRVWGKRAACLSALGMAVAPSIVVEGHFNATGTTSLFWFMLTVFFVVRAYQDGFRFTALALIAGSLSFLTKPTGISALVLVGLFTFWQLAERYRRSAKARLRIILSVVLVAICIGVLVALRWQLLMRIIPNFLWTYEKGTQPAFAWLWVVQHDGVLLAFGLLGILTSRIDGHRPWPILITGSFYIVGSLFFQIFFVRWLIPLVALLTVFVGPFGEKLLTRSRRPFHYLAVGLLLAGFVFLGWDAHSLVQNLDNDVREQSWIWIREHIPPGSRLAVQGNWLSTNAAGLSYRAQSFDVLPEEPGYYEDAGFNYVVRVTGRLDYYNWRRLPDDPGLEQKYQALYDAFDLLHKETGTILHIPVAVDVDILQITANPVYPEGQLVLGGGWHGEEDADGTPRRWMTERGELFYNHSGEAGEKMVFSFDAYVFRDEDRITAYVNDQPGTPLSFDGTEGLRQVEIPVDLVEGLNHIELVSERGCGRPVVYNPESKDTRCISIKVGNLRLEAAP
jgi:hypothetical protein